MKFPRSFSLLTFLMVATIAAIAFALYQAKTELAEKEALFQRYSEELGFIDAKHDSQLYFRRLGGYSPMSFAFRYQLPVDQNYILKIGSGVVDQKTGFPPVVMKRMMKNDASQGTLVVNLHRFPQLMNDCWIVQCIDQESSRGTACEKSKFAWLETKLIDLDGAVNGRALKMVGQGLVNMSHRDDRAVVLCTEHEDNSYPYGMHPVPDGILEKQTFMIWLEHEKTQKSNPATQSNHVD